MKKNTLNSNEWQLLLVLRELNAGLSKKEKQMNVVQWIRKKLQKLEQRSGW